MNANNESGYVRLVHKPSSEVDRELQQYVLARIYAHPDVWERRIGVLEFVGQYEMLSVKGSETWNRDYLVFQFQNWMYRIDAYYDKNTNNVELEIQSASLVEPLFPSESDSPSS